jgi:hypothetical protein
LFGRQGGLAKKPRGPSGRCRLARFGTGSGAGD